MPASPLQTLRKVLLRGPAPSIAAGLGIVGLSWLLYATAVGLSWGGSLPAYVCQAALQDGSMLLFLLATVAAWQTPNWRAWSVSAGTAIAPLAVFIEGPPGGALGLEWVSLPLASALTLLAVYPVDWIDPAQASRPLGRWSVRSWLLLVTAVALVLGTIILNWIGLCVTALFVAGELGLVVALLARRARWMWALGLLVATPLGGRVVDILVERQSFGVGAVLAGLGDLSQTFPYPAMAQRLFGGATQLDSSWGLSFELGAMCLTTCAMALALRAAGLRRL